MGFSDEMAAEQTNDLSNGVMQQLAEYQAIHARAVEYGAQDVEPRGHGTPVLEWPADPERVSLERITYWQESGEFSGWSLRTVPEWTQK